MFLSPGEQREEHLDSLFFFCNLRYVDNTISPAENNKDLNLLLLKLKEKVPKKRISIEHEQTTIMTTE